MASDKDTSDPAYKAVSKIKEAPKSAAKRKNISDEGSAGKNVFPEASKKKAKTKTSEQLPIPKTTDDFTVADRMLWDMRKAGKGWKEIGEQWERQTGQKVASTTLPNRYMRIKEHIGDFTAEDDVLLLKCKKELELTWTKELWAMISEQIVIKGGEKFSGPSIEKRYKQLVGIIKMENTNSEEATENGVVASES